MTSFLRDKFGFHKNDLHWETDRQDTAIALAASVGFNVAVGTFIGFLSTESVQTWFKTLRKPFWQPPGWLFGPVWTVLYILMGFAAWAVWTHGGFSAQPDALLLYAANLMLNFAWNPIFFNLKRLDWAMLDITALLATLVPLIFMFNRIEPLAAVALLPYLAWVAFAAVLNYTLLKMNPQASSSYPTAGQYAVPPSSSADATKKEF